MVGLSEADMEQIRKFARKPRYSRSPDQLGEEEEQEAEQ